MSLPPDPLSSPKEDPTNDDGDSVAPNNLISHFLDNEDHIYNQENKEDEDVANSLVGDALADITNQIAIEVANDQETDNEENGDVDEGSPNFDDAIANLVGDIFNQIQESNSNEEHNDSQDGISQQSEANEDELISNVHESTKSTSQLSVKSSEIVDSTNSQDKAVHSKIQAENDNTSKVNESLFDIGSAVTDAIAQIANSAAEEASKEDDSTSLTQDSAAVSDNIFKHNTINETVGNADDNLENRKDEDASSTTDEMDSNLADAISKMVSETVNQISSTKHNALEPESEEAEKNKVDTHDAAPDAANDKVSEVIARMVNDTVNQVRNVSISEVAQKDDIQEQPKPQVVQVEELTEKPETDMSATELLISSAVNDIIKTVTAQSSDLAEEQTFQDEELEVVTDANDAIAQMVQNVVQSITKTSEAEDSKDDNNGDFELAMNEMIQNIADEIVSDDEVPNDPNGLQFAIEEMVKNVVDETFEDNTELSAASRSSLIDSLLSNSDLTSSIVASTLNQRRQLQGVADGKKSLDLNEELLKNRSIISAKEYSNTPNLRDLLNKHASQAVTSGLTTSLPYRTSFYSGNYSVTEGPHGSNTSAKATTTIEKSKQSTASSRSQSGRSTPSTGSSMNQSVTQGLNTAIQKILADTTLSTILQIDNKEKTRLENRTRKQKWREKNNARNKDNDLRFRISKRANKLFGESDSEEKRKWVTNEFETRKLKRIERLRKINEEENLSYAASLSERMSTASRITTKLLGLVNSASLHQLTPETSETLTTAIATSLENVHFDPDVTQEQLAASATSYLANFFHLNIEKSNDTPKTNTLATVNKKITPPNVTPDKELTSLVKSGATGGSAYFKMNYKKPSTPSTIKSTAIDPSFTNESTKDVNNTLSSAFSTISLVPTKRSNESTSTAAPSSKKVDTGTSASSSRPSSFRLPVYRKNMSSIASAVIDAAKAKPASITASNNILANSNSSNAIKPILSNYKKSIDASSTEKSTSPKPTTASSTITATKKPISVNPSTFSRPRKPSILASLDGKKVPPRTRPSLSSVLAQQTGSGTGSKTKLGFGSFRRPVYRSTSSH